MAQDERRLPLTATQEGIWLAEQIAETHHAYVISHGVELRGPVDGALLSAAIRRGLAEADTVTARYRQTPEGAMQVLVASVDDVAAPELFDWRDRADGEAQAWAAMRADTQAELPPDSEVPLYRQALYRIAAVGGEERWLWYQRYHHLSLDGYSFTRLTRRIAAIYSALVAGVEPEPTPFISVSEVIEEQRAWRESPAWAKSREFWRGYVDALPTPTTLSLRGPAGDAGSGEVLVHEVEFAPSTLARLQAVIEAHPQAARLTVPDLLLSLLGIYLARITGQSSQALGLPMMGRMGSVAIRSTAPVVNVLPLNLELGAQSTWLSAAEALRRGIAQLRPHQRYPAEQIQRDTQRLGSGQRLYGAVLNYKAFDYALDFAGVSAHTHHLATGPVDDLEFGLATQQSPEGEQRIRLELRAEAGRYDIDELIAHAARISELLAAALATPERSVWQLELMPQAERDAIAAWSNGYAVAPSESLETIVDLLFREAGRSPQNTALICGDTRLSFGELAADVARLSRWLVAQGAGVGQCVGVAIPRSADAVTAMLGVLHSGAAFLPLDLDYPAERIAAMCEDAQPRLLLSRSDVDAELPTQLPRWNLDAAVTRAQLSSQWPQRIRSEERVRAITSDSIAYVIFTSGSTGRPKGVMNTQGSLLNLVASHRQSIYGPALAECQRRHPSRALRAAHTHSFSFDSSWLQIFWLLLGQELHVFDEDERRDAYALVQAVDRLKIDAFDLAPSFASQMIGNGLFATGRHHPTLILIGGEAAPAALWQQLREAPSLLSHNLYGPTENTVDTLRADLADSARPLIGRPIGNVQAHVLDARLQAVPVGTVGELYIGGAGLALGYLGRADLSAARFIANPFGEPGSRLYRSGDLVRWNAEGRLEFIGRGDDQVKVRGYRVEIGEVENALSLLPGVESAAVVAQAVHGSHRLLGYCVLPGLSASERTSRAATLLTELRRSLPDYMVPAVLTLMDEFPRNVSGKVDRKRLPPPQISVEAALPADAREASVCELMARVLNLSQAGVEDDFFALGGDSISAIMLCSELRKLGHALRPREVFSGRTPRALAQVMTALELQGEAPTTRWEPPAAQAEALRARYGDYAAAAPVLPLQKGMLFHAQLGQGAGAGAGNYTAYTRVDFEGELDAVRLRRALDALLLRHPQLFGLFDSETGEEPVFLLPPAEAALSWPWQQHDFSPMNEGEREAQRLAVEERLLAAEYDSSRYGGMLGAALIQLSPQSHQLLLAVHHLVIDGWSTPLLLRDLIAAYREDTSLPALRTGYAEVVSALHARDAATAREWWRQAMGEVQPTIVFESLPANAGVQEFELKLPVDLTTKLMAELRRRGLTLNVLMQALWAQALSTLTGKDEVVFGTPVSGRGADIEGLQDQVGLFLNTLPVRLRLDARAPLWPQLAAMQDRHAQLMEQDGIGLAEIQRIAGHAQLFDTLLVVENYPDNDYLAQPLPGLDGGALRMGEIHNRGYSHYPLALLVLPGEQLTLLIENRGALADPEQLAQRLLRQLHTLLREPELPFSRWPLMSETEEAFVARVNDTHHELPALTLRDRLREQAAATPQAPALRDARHALSYAELSAQVTALAAQLIAAGVKPGGIVAIALPRSVRLTLAIHAVIEAGAAYLPLDMSYPDERLAYMLANAGASLLITQDESRQRFATMGETTLLAYDELLPANEAVPIEVPVSPQHPAYLLYTSGTTGKPKGVLVSHEAIVNRIEWMQHEYQLRTSDVVLQKTPCSFDVSVWEFFWPLMTGAQLVMAEPDAHRDPQALVQAIEHYGVSCLHFVPSMLAIFTSNALENYAAERALCSSLQLVFCSGEALTRQQARDFGARFNAELHNLYGPTEVAVDVSYQPALTELSEGGAGVPIGLPVWNTGLQVLDAWLRPLPPGAVGELYLSGVQLALGYLNRADLSATRFVADPAGHGTRLYRTGDMVRRLPSGAIEYLGRADDQVKIRGQRIELGEIETLLRREPGVANAVVHALALSATNSSQMDQRQLVAYLVPQQAAVLDIERIRASLQKQLPAHFLPTAYVELEQLPLSANGKLDRKALPRPASTTADARKPGRTPTRGLEARLAALFAQLLELPVEQVGADDDFFALGGHSLLAMRLAAQIRRELQRPVSVGQIMLAPSVEQLAAQLNDDVMLNDFGNEGFAPVIHLRKGQGAPLFCFYPGSGFAWQYSVLSRYLKTGRGIVGLQSPRPDGLIATSASMEQLVQSQLRIIRELQPQGPYDLLGYSLGGTVAYAVAAQLRAQGEDVRFLGLLDTYPAEVHDWNDPQGAEAAMGAEREQAQVLGDAYEEGTQDDAMRREKEAMLATIFANYKDAVRLLQHTRTPRYDGEVTVFVAEQSLPDYVHPNSAWRPYAADVRLHRLPEASHETILSPASLRTLGPLLDALLERAAQPRVQLASA